MTKYNLQDWLQITLKSLISKEYDDIDTTDTYFFYLLDNDGQSD